MTEKIPRIGTMAAEVLPYVIQGFSNTEIANLLGRRRRVIAHARSYLTSNGYAEKPDANSIKTSRALGISKSKGGILLLVQPFAQLHMAHVEIMEATRQFFGLELRRSQVIRAITNAERSGYFRREWLGDKEAIATVRRENKVPKEEISERIRLWLEARQVLDKNKVIYSTHSRKEWLLLSRYLAICQKIYTAADDETEIAAELEEAVFLATLDDAVKSQLKKSLDILHDHTVPFTRRQLSQLFILQRKMIYGTVYNIVREPNLAEDLTAEVFYRAWSNRSSYKHRAGKSLLAWIQTIARNSAIDHSIKSTHHPQVEFNDGILHETAVSFENSTLDKTLLREALEKIPEEFKAVLVMKFIHGLEIEEIAEAIGRSRTVVITRTAKGLDLLRTLLS